MNSPSIVAVVSRTLMAEFFSASDLARLHVASGTRDRFVRVDSLADVRDLSQVRIILTSWGSEPFTAELLAQLPNLELIAHTGATVRPLVTDAVFDRGIRITQAGGAMARSVAEVALTFTLALLHRVPQMHHRLRESTGWYEADGAQHELRGATIAVIGASRTGRAYLELLQLLRARPLLVDPTLNGGEAFGAEVVSLDEALGRAQIVSLHAPSLPETQRLIGARQLSRMPDGAGLVNTARSWLVDEAALIVELQSGRISAAMDVFDETPLPHGHPFRGLSNTLLTPHRAAGTVEGRLRQGQFITDDIEALVAGEPMAHSVTQEQLRFMA